MTYRNLLLPTGVDLEWTTSPGFSTSVVRTDNGKEKRNVDWDASLARGMLRYNARKRAVWAEIDEMFQVCHGRAYSFRVRDPRHNVATVAQGKFDGAQAVLRITRGSYTIDKVITKPDASVVLTGGTAPTISADTGIATGSPTGWSGPYYLCMRFDTDELELTGIDKENSGDLIAGYGDVPIVEVLGE
jgi:uncharacterized protein (TIGR02217 family)